VVAMAKLGQYLKLSELKNSDNKYTLENLKGISIQKCFIQSKADMDGVPLKNYLVVEPQHFSYVPTTSRNGEKITLAHNKTNQTYIVSSSYFVFYVKDTSNLLPDYLYMYFNRPEFDRYARFNSWGSAREAFTWDDLCDIEIDLPSIAEQQKVVDVYNAMLKNQKTYETGLEDLKLTCDAYIENLRREMPSESIGKYIEQRNEKNTNNKIKLAQGVNVEMQFIPAKRVAEDKENAKVVYEGQFAYNKVMKANGTKLPIALRKGVDCFVSGSYQVFEVIRKNELLSEYLMLWLSRTEIQRYAGFISWGSTRDVLDFETLGEIAIPITSIETQQAIVNIYNAYIMRKEINEQLKKQMKDICPVLIRGSLKK
jgi:type I restriction enzyme, S subunit